MPILHRGNAAKAEREAFSKKLIALMRDNDLNQADLARKSGLTRDAISTYVRSRSMPEPGNLALLAKALNVQPSYFREDNLVLNADGDGLVPAKSLTRDRCEIKLQPDGTARIEIIANVPMENATRLAQVWREIATS